MARRGNWKIITLSPMQTTTHILMVRPAAFAFNPQTASDNAFQNPTQSISLEKALHEFDNMVTGLRAAGVTVLVIEDSPHPPKPDAVFPNNWFCTLPDGQLCLFPMRAENRRPEKSPAIIARIQQATQQARAGILEQAPKAMPQTPQQQPQATTDTAQQAPQATSDTTQQASQATTGASNQAPDAQTDNPQPQSQEPNLRPFLDFSPYESQNKFLEGTGSMVPDHIHKRIYACESPRTHPELVRHFCEQTGYTPILFQASGRHGHPIYHTNVMMCIGESFSTICQEAISEPTQRQEIRQQLETSGREIIAISLDQMESFAGNMLQLKTDAGKKIIVMSENACRALSATQQAQLQRHGQLMSFPLDTIEANGGSARCMIAELF